MGNKAETALTTGQLDRETTFLLFTDRHITHVFMFITLYQWVEPQAANLYTQLFVKWTNPVALAEQPTR